MAVTALIVFTQGDETSIGEAMVGMLSDGSVTVTNSDNTDVSSWTIELIGAPPDSGISTGVLSFATSSTPSASFLPDVFGSYRVQLTLVGTDGSTSTDIRVFTVPLGLAGYILPPWQGYPEPLPLTGVGAKPNELNFGGQAFGWMGTSSDDYKLLHKLIQDVDELVGLPSMVGAADGYVPSLRVAEFNEPIAVVSAGRRAYVLCSAYSDEADTSVFAHLTEYNPDSNRPLSDTEVSSSSVSLVAAAYDGAQYIWTAAKSGSTGAVRRFDTTTKTISLTTSVASAAAVGLVFGGGYLWYIDTANVTRIDPSAPGLQVTVSGLQGTPTPTAVCYDTDGSNYGDNNPRVWIADSALPGLQRLTFAGVGDVYSTLSNTVPSCVAVGAGYVWTAAVNTSSGYATLYRINPDTGALNSSSTDIDGWIDGAGGGSVYDVLYDSITDALYVLAEDSAGVAYLLKVNRSTLVVATALSLGSHTVSSGGPPPRLTSYKGDIWVPLMDGEVLRVDPASMTLDVSLNPYASVEFVAPSASALSLAGVSDAYKIIAANAAGTAIEASTATMTPTELNIGSRSFVTTGGIDLSGGAAPTGYAVGLVNQAAIALAAAVSGEWVTRLNASDELQEETPEGYTSYTTAPYAGVCHSTRRRVTTSGTTPDTSVEFTVPDGYFGYVTLELVAENQVDETVDYAFVVIAQRLTVSGGVITLGTAMVNTIETGGDGSLWTYAFSDAGSNALRLTLTGSGVLDITWLATLYLGYGSLT